MVLCELAAKWLREAFNLIKSVFAVLEEDDPHPEHSSKVSRGVCSAMQSSQEILH